MGPIDRNDPYAPGRDLSFRSTDATGANTADVSNHDAHDAFYYIRIGGALLGAGAVIVGLYFAALCFDLLRGVLLEPQQLNSYLDAWYVPPHAAETATPAPALTPEVVQGAPLEVPAPPGSAPAEPASATLAPAGDGTADAGAALPPEAAESLRKLAAKGARPRPVSVQHEGPTLEKSIALLTDALTRGGLPRLAGAIVLLILVSMLVRVPFGVIKAGIEIVRWSVPERPKKPS